MKKTVLTVGIVLFFTIFFVLVFRYTSNATALGAESTQEIQEKNEENSEAPKSEKELKREEAKEYIKEKIIPVVIGVLTSVSAILATLGAIKRALNSIGDTKELFKKEAKNRDEKFQKESEYLTKKAEEIESALALIPRLEKEVAALEVNTSKLMSECRDLGKMISLGFSQDERVISSGNGQKIERLLTELELTKKTEAGYEKI